MSKWPSWVSLSTASGIGSARITVGVNSGYLASTSNASETITIQAGSSPYAQLTIPVKLQTLTTTAAPFGSFDTPGNNATGLASNIAVTGWALDDIGVDKVQIWRDKVGNEPVHPNGLVYIADAVFVPGARPDVEAAYPGTPQASRAGWGYLMLTNFLPALSGAPGNGTYKLYAYAVDKEGKQTLLGSKIITVDNARSTKPFGTIDTPNQGETISGSAYINFGWALTPMPYKIPIDGSSMYTSIDGVFLPGHPVYNQYRSDIANAFPAYANSNGAVGYYFLNTTTLSNGMHNIGWLVYDEANRGDGIGSRFINVLNSGSTATSTSTSNKSLLAQARALRPQIRTQTGLAYKIGYALDEPLRAVRRGGAGLYESIQMHELERLELHLPELGPGTEWTAGLRVGDELRSLPVGSTFDEEDGVFYWQLGPGFLGEYTLEFRPATEGLAEAVTIPLQVRRPAR